MTDLVERLRDAAGKNYDPLGHEAADEIALLRGACKDKADLLKHAYADIERLRGENELVREVNIKTIEKADAEIERLRSLLRGTMSELLIAQEDNQMTSAGYRGEWLGELIETCQRGLENREASR